MIGVFKKWLTARFSPQRDESILEAYRIIFNSPHGEILLNHWMDDVYCTVLPETATDIELATHNGRRSFIDDILRRLEMAMKKPNETEVIA
jgi:hypothetical protein